MIVCCFKIGLLELNVFKNLLVFVFLFNKNGFCIILIGNNLIMYRVYINILLW